MGVSSTTMAALLGFGVIVSGTTDFVLFFLIGQYLEDYPDLVNLVQCGVDTYIFFVALGLRSLWRSRRKPATSSPPSLLSPTARTPGSLGVGFEQITVVSGTSYGMWKHYCIIGLMIALNGAAIQNADPHLSGYLQPLLSSVTVPLTGLFAWYVNGVKLTKFMWLGSIVVIVGLLIAVLPPAFETQPNPAADSKSWNKPGWILLFLLGTIPMAFQSVWQEKVFSSSISGDPLQTLAWSGLFAMPFYALVVPISAIWHGGWSLAWYRQYDGLKCLFQAHPTVSGCITGAWIYMFAYIIAYAVFFFCLAILIQKESAMYQALVITLITPLTAMAFAVKPMMGRFSEDLTWYSILSLFVISSGLLVYRGDDFRHANIASKLRSWIRCEKAGGDEDSEVLNLLNSTPASPDTGLPSRSPHDADTPSVTVVDLT